jgi:hypothetical protein
MGEELNIVTSFQSQRIGLSFGTNSHNIHGKAEVEDEGWQGYRCADTFRSVSFTVRAREGAYATNFTSFAERNEREREREREKQANGT